MTLNEYASAIRYHDWSACMSDDGSVVSRARTHRALLMGTATASKNHERLWELGRTYEANFTWDKPSTFCSEEKRFEDGWRWVGAYCWARGLKLSEDEAKALVDPIGAVDGRWNVSGRPDWKRIDERLKAKES